MSPSFSSTTHSSSSFASSSSSSSTLPSLSRALQQQQQPAPPPSALASSTAPLSLTARLAALSDARKTTLALINRLAKLPSDPGRSGSGGGDAVGAGAHDGDGDGDDDDDDGNDGDDRSGARGELSAEIHHLLREQDEELALLRQEIEDYVPIGGGSGVGSASGSGGRERREAERARLEVWALRLAEDLKLYVRDSIKSCFFSFCFPPCLSSLFLLSFLAGVFFLLSFPMYFSISFFLHYILYELIGCSFSSG